MKSTIKNLSLDQLTIDPHVQRVEGIDQVRVNKMVAAFNPDGLGVIFVSDRGGKLVVLDGMHRTAAARQVGYKGTIRAEVATGLTIAQEAEQFLIRNDGRMPSSISKFHARYVMGEPAAVAITDILARHGWQVSPSSDPGHLAATDAIDRVYRNAGGVLADGEHAELTDRVIEIVTAAWEHDGKATHGHMLLAVAQLLGRFGPAIDTKKLVDEMSATRPAVLIGKAKTLKDLQGGTVPAALAKTLAGMHNKKRRSNLLPDWVWIR
jgi:hypothetical protein